MNGNDDLISKPRNPMHIFLKVGPSRTLPMRLDWFIYLHIICTDHPEAPGSLGGAPGDARGQRALKSPNGGRFPQREAHLSNVVAIGTQYRTKRQFKRASRRTRRAETKIRYLFAVHKQAHTFLIYTRAELREQRRTPCTRAYELPTCLCLLPV